MSTTIVCSLLSAMTSPQETVSHNSKLYSYQYMTVLKPHPAKPLILFIVRLALCERQIYLCFVGIIRQERRHV